MDRTIKKYLQDIMQAIGEVELYLTQRPKEYQVFLDDSMFRNAIERQIGIIGEAMTKILQIMPDIPITNARKIKGTRNYLIHAYDSLQPFTIWGIVINHLPKLKDEVSQLLNVE